MCRERQDRQRLHERPCFSEEGRKGLRERERERGRDRRDSAALVSDSFVVHWYPYILTPVFS